MEDYYVNRRAHAKGEHEVHRAGCSFMPYEKNRHCLGSFKNCSDAVLEAKKYYPKSDGCFFCSRESHNR